MRVVGDAWVLWQWPPGLDPGLAGGRRACLRCVDAEGSSGLSARNLYDARLLIVVTLYCYISELSWGGVSNLICISRWVGHIASI